MVVTTHLTWTNWLSVPVLQVPAERDETSRSHIYHEMRVRKVGILKPILTHTQIFHCARLIYISSPDNSLLGISNSTNSETPSLSQVIITTQDTVIPRQYYLAWRIWRVIPVKTSGQLPSLPVWVDRDGVRSRIGIQSARSFFMQKRNMWGVKTQPKKATQWNEQIVHTAPVAFPYFAKWVLFSGVRNDSV